ncbi:MAG: uncharacterized protein KVP18_001318 [Porospora cf. gigantea A]|uniref:uncharacterized protein n=1 Tax=Porospora cf. gigantea A TaxID=2853593 RepID=UPI003559E5E7|nr:MAG: hypothetical protein KVP18_001318 [Porospora cf. gigantea A]
MAKHEQLLEKKRLRERTLIRQVRSSDASTLLRRLRDLHMLDPQIHVDDTDMLDEEAPLPPVTFGEVQEFLKDEVDVELASNVKAAERSVVSFAHPHEARPNWVRTSFNLVAVFSSITVISGWTRSNDGIVYWAELKAAGLLLWQAPPHRKEDGAPIPPNTSTVSRNLVLALYFLPHHPPVVCRPPPQWAQRLQFDPIYTIVGLDLNTGGPHPFNMETSSVQKWIRKDHKSRRRSGKRIELDLGYLFPLSGLVGDTNPTHTARPQEITRPNLCGIVP